MRLATTFPFSVVPLAVLSLATWVSVRTQGIVAVEPLHADITSSVEPVLQREQVRVHREPWAHHSVWRGTYVCGQGVSAMTLTIDVGRSGVAIARYDFGAVTSNPTVPTGAFFLEGSLSPKAGGGFTGELVPTRWVVQPDGYFMVPLSISSDGLRMSGKSHHETCLPFEITRAN